MLCPRRPQNARAACPRAPVGRRGGLTADDAPITNAEKPRRTPRASVAVAATIVIAPDVADVAIPAVS